jgi:hypothetical protein
MNTKEIGEIRRHLRRDRSNITRLYGVYVNDNKEIISQFSQSTGMMSENEGEKYFALLPLKGEKELDLSQKFMLYEVEEDEENNPVVMYIESDVEYAIAAQYFSRLLDEK